jgi:hypothetical protein
MLAYRADALAPEAFMRIVEKPRHEVSVRTSTASVRRAGYRSVLLSKKAKKVRSISQTLGFVHKSVLLLG